MKTIEITLTLDVNTCMINAEMGDYDFPVFAITKIKDTLDGRVMGWKLNGQYYATEENMLDAAVKTLQKNIARSLARGS